MLSLTVQYLACKIHSSDPSASFSLIFLLFSLCFYHHNYFPKILLAKLAQTWDSLLLLFPWTRNLLQPPSLKLNWKQYFVWHSWSLRAANSIIPVEMFTAWALVRNSITYFVLELSMQDQHEIPNSSTQLKYISSIQCRPCLLWSLLTSGTFTNVSVFFIQ